MRTPTAYFLRTTVTMLDGTVESDTSYNPFSSEAAARSYDRDLGFGEYDRKTAQIQASGDFSKDRDWESYSYEYVTTPPVYGLERAAEWYRLNTKPHILYQTAERKFAAEVIARAYAAEAGFSYGKAIKVLKAAIKVRMAKDAQMRADRAAAGL